MFEEVLLKKPSSKRLGLCVTAAAASLLLIATASVVWALVFPQSLLATNLMDKLYTPLPPPPAPSVKVFTEKRPPAKQPTIEKPPGVLFTPTAIPPGILYVDDPVPVADGVPGGNNRDRTGSCVICDILKNTQPPEAAPAPPPPPPPPPPAPPERIRVGGNVQAANLVDKAVPAYPPLAKQARVQGTVVLEAVIGKDGSITNLKVISGHPLLNQAAIDAVSKWRYKPTLLNGEPVEVVTTITVTFGFSQ